MEARKIVLRETAIVAAGTAIGTGLMLGVYALLGRLQIPVLLGALVGFVLTVGNFFFMAMVASLAADRAQKQDVEGGKKMVQTSQISRLFALGAILGLCGISKKFDLIALVLPLVFVRPVLLVAEFFRKKG